MNWQIDETILSNPSNENGTRALDYYLNACAHLSNVLRADPKLRNSPLAEVVAQLLTFSESDPSDCDYEEKWEAAYWLGLFGAVGSALWFLRGKDDPQLHRELTRLATEPNQIVGNQYLFYIAGILASRGYDIKFVTEQSKDELKTPDLLASKAGKRTWIEANTKTPKIVVDTPERLARMIHGIFEEKKLKFGSAAYSPGLIVADISPAWYLVNETGSPPDIKLMKSVQHGLPSGGFLYRLYDDPEWSTLPENKGNVVAYVVDELRRIDHSKYHVSQCLITITRRALKGDGMFVSRKLHLLVVDRYAEDDALVDLARIVYSV